MVNKGETAIKSQGQGVKKEEVAYAVTLADYQVGWLKILRDEINDYEVCERHINRLQVGLQAYYSGNPVPGVDYKGKIQLLTTLKGRQSGTLRYLTTVFDEVKHLDSNFNAIIINYLRSPELTIRELADDLGITQQTVRRVLEKYNRELDEKNKGYKSTASIRDFIERELPGVFY